MIETKRLKVIKDPKQGFIVAHTFVPDDDLRRHTDFYQCGNAKAAYRLMRCIRNAPRKSLVEI